MPDDAPEKKVQAWRCPQCGAQVVDRRFAKCTTCHAPLPADWVLTPAQVDQIQTNDQHARAEHAVALDGMDSAEMSDDIQLKLRELETDLPGAALEP